MRAAGVAAVVELLADVQQFSSAGRVSSSTSKLSQVSAVGQSVEKAIRNNATVRCPTLV
jgi:hypothetical protein